MSDMEIYLDNSATTAVYPEVAEEMVRLMCRDYGNPSSMHQKGVEAERELRQATETLAKLLKVQPKEIYYTSGGTESNNWALLGCALANRRAGKHIVTTVIEHAAIKAPAEFLAEQGFEITYLGVNREGCVDPAELAAALRPDTILVSVMYVNNELGSVQPVEELARIVHQNNPNTYFHVDAIQAFGKYRIFPKRMGIDLMSASGHKFHGPKGVGLLYADSRVKIRPMILGGGQQGGMRSGTDNVPGAVGMARAAGMVCEDLDRQVERIRQVKRRLYQGLLELPDVVIHGMSPEEGAPQIINASFLGVRSEVLLHALEERGIYVSAGSACSSHKRSGSAVLKAIGCSKQEWESAVRFSFCEQNTVEEMDTVLETLRELLPVLRRFQRR